MKNKIFLSTLIATLTLSYQAKALSYNDTYDTNNRLIQRTFDNGKYIKYDYDAGGQKNGVTMYDASGTAIQKYEINSDGSYNIYAGKDAVSSNTYSVSYDLPQEQNTQTLSANYWQTCPSNNCTWENGYITKRANNSNTYSYTFDNGNLTAVTGHYTDNNGYDHEVIYSYIDGKLEKTTTNLYPPANVTNSSQTVYYHETDGYGNVLFRYSVVNGPNETDDSLEDGFDGMMYSQSSIVIYNSDGNISTVWTTQGWDQSELEYVYENGILTGLRKDGSLIETYETDENGNIIAKDLDGNIIGTYKDASNMAQSRYLGYAAAPLKKASVKKRIYTVEEANAVAGEKNRVSITYR